MDLKELTKLSVSQLRGRESELRKEIMDLRFEHAIGKLLNTGLPKQKRKELARVLTLLNANRVEA